MSDFIKEDFMEEELRKALARHDAPDGFTERVMANMPKRRSELRMTWYAAIAAVLAIALVFSGVEQRRQIQRQKAKQTERQVVFAIALAMRHFERVNVQLQKSAPTLKIEEKHGGQSL
jgi:hypothetical protein